MPRRTSTTSTTTPEQAPEAPERLAETTVVALAQERLTDGGAAAVARCEMRGNASQDDRTLPFHHALLTAGLVGDYTPQDAGAASLSADWKGGKMSPQRHAFLTLCAEGYSTTEICERQHIAFATGKGHRFYILRQFGVHSMVEAVVLAVRYGILPVPEALREQPEPAPRPRRRRAPRTTTTD